MDLKTIVLVNSLALMVMVQVSSANETGGSVTNQSSSAVKPPEAWVYKSEAHGFSITLPDAGWVARPSSIHGAVGFLKKGFAMRTDIFVVACESEIEFQGLAGRVKNEMDSAQTVSGTHHESGKNKAGRPYQLSLGTEKTQRAPTGVFLGQSVVWIKEKKIALRVCFQGESVNRSASIQGVDPKELETSARSICLSVE